MLLNYPGSWEQTLRYAVDAVKAMDSQGLLVLPIHGSWCSPHPDPLPLGEGRGEGQMQN